MISIRKTYHNSVPATQVQFQISINLQTVTWTAPLTLKVMIESEDLIPAGKTYGELIESASSTNKSSTWTELFTACKERIEPIFNQRYADFDFSMEDSWLVLDSATALECLADIKGLNVTRAAIEVLVHTKAQPFEGLTRDGLEYTAAMLISYLPLPGCALDPEIDLITQLELDDCKELFVQRWSERTIKDIIETYDDRSPAEQLVFKPSCKAKALRHIQICDRMAVIWYQCKIMSTIESELVRVFMEKQKSHDTMITWLFYCLLGLVGGYLYGAVRHMHRTLRGLYTHGSVAAISNPRGFNIRNCYEYSQSWPSTIKDTILKGYPVAVIWFPIALASIYLTSGHMLIRILMTVTSTILFGLTGASIWLF